MVIDPVRLTTAKRLLALSLIFALAQSDAFSSAIHKQYHLAGTHVGVTITGGGNGPLNVNFTNVAPEVVAAILTRMQGGAVLDASGTDVTIGQMTYNCPPVGQCSKVVLARPL